MSNDPMKQLADSVERFQSAFVMPIIKELIKQMEDKLMTEDKNQNQVKTNDSDTGLQVPGILQDHTGVNKHQERRNEELFYRAIAK